MSASLSVEPEEEPVERVQAEVVVVGLFETERPLRGAAGRVDWRLCGLLSQLAAQDRVRGRRGDAALIPTFGRLRGRRLLVLGLGEREGFGAPELTELAREATARLVELRATLAALAPPLEEQTGLSSIATARALAAGALAGLAGSAGEMRLKVVMPGAAASQARAGFEAAVRENASEILLELAPGASKPGPAPRPTPARAASPD